MLYDPGLSKPTSSAVLSQLKELIVSEDPLLGPTPSAFVARLSARDCSNIKSVLRVIIREFTGKKLEGDEEVRLLRSGLFRRADGSARRTDRFGYQVHRERISGFARSRGPAILVRVRLDARTARREKGSESVCAANECGRRERKTKSRDRD